MDGVFEPGIRDGEGREESLQDFAHALGVDRLLQVFPKVQDQLLLAA